MRELWKLVPNFRCDWSFTLSTLDWLTNGPSGAGHVARGGARNTREKKQTKNYNHLKWRKVLACPAFCITWLTSWKGPIDWTWLIRDWLIATLCATVRKPLSLEHYYVIIRYILFVLVDRHNIDFKTLGSQAAANLLGEVSSRVKFYFYFFFPSFCPFLLWKLRDIVFGAEP